MSCEGRHNHGPVTALSALPAHRIASMTLQEKSRVKEMQTLYHSPSQILQTLHKDNPDCVLIPRDIYNLLASQRIDELNGQTPIQWLLQVNAFLDYDSNFTIANNSNIEA